MTACAPTARPKYPQTIADVEPNPGFPKTRWRVFLTAWGWRAEPYDHFAHEQFVTRHYHIKDWSEAINYANIMARLGRAQFG